MKDFLSIESNAEDEFLGTLLDAVEDLFEAECGRRDRPFRAAQAARVELHDGTGTDVLYLQYPPSAITTIAIGVDVADPDETIVPSDLQVLSWRVGYARLVRVDGGTWGERGAPNVVRVTYDAQADLPTPPKLAIKRVVAAVYRQMGAEDVKSERTSSFSRDLADVAAGDPIWQLAVRCHREVKV